MSECCGICGRTQHPQDTETELLTFIDVHTGRRFTRCRQHAYTIIQKRELAA